MFLLRAAALIALILFSAGARAQSAPEFFLDLDTGGHRAFVKKVAFTPDGEFLVSASDDKTIRIWDWKNGVTLRTLRGQIGEDNTGKIFAIAISPDGKTIAAAGYFGSGIDNPPYGEVRLFDFSTGSVKAVLSGAQDVLYAVAFSPDGTFIAAGGQEGLAFVWRADASSPNGWTAEKTLDAESWHIDQLAFAAGGSRLVATTTDNGVWLWDFATDERIELPGGDALADSPTRALAVSANGGLFAFGNDAGRVEVRQAEDGALVKTLPAQDYLIGSLTFANGSERLVVSCGYGCLDTYRTTVWTLGQDAPPLAYAGHDWTVYASAATPDGLLVATAGGFRHAIHVWDPVTGETRNVLEGVGRPVMAVGIDPRGETIAWGNIYACPDRNGCPEVQGALTSLLDLPTPDRFFEQPRPAGADVAGFNRAVLSAGSVALRIADVGSDEIALSRLDILIGGTVARSITRDATSGYTHSAIALIDGGKRLLSGGNDGTLLEYDTATGEIVGQFAGGHTGEINEIAVAEAASLLVTGASDQTVRLWNLRTRELIASFFFAEREWIAWMPQGYYMSSDDGDKLVGWHVNQGQGKEGRFVRAVQLKRYLWSPEMVRRAIILKSAKAAVAEMRPGQDRQLAQLLEKRPPEFDVKVADDQSNVREGYVRVEVVGAEEAEANVAEFAILSNSRSVGDLVTRSVTGDGKRTVIEVPIEEGQNEIRITGTNELGYLSERSVVALGKPRREQVRKGKLYAVVIGVEKYPLLPTQCRGRSCDLRFPVDDAAGFLDMLARKTAPLFNGMEALVMINREALDETPEQAEALGAIVNPDDILEPDSDTVSDELQDFLDKPGPDDTTIVFVAGHGINIDEDYYFIPTDGRQDGDRWKRSSLVEWSDIQKAVERADGIRFLMLDTCYAANSFNPRLEKDAADARIIVFSATAANNTALELAELQHGVFTYALLQGLGGKAKTSDAGVTLFGLADYIGREIVTLTQSRQKPYYYVSGVENLLLAQP